MLSSHPSSPGSPVEFKNQFKVQWRVPSTRSNSIYLCDDRLLRRKVIVKIFTDKSKVKRCYKAFLTLKDTGVVPGIIDKGDQDGQTYLVFEHKGTSLRDLYHLNNKTMNKESVAMLALKLLKILKLMHAKGIIHGNIGPRKILIDHSKEHRFCLQDFSYHSKPKKTAPEAPGKSHHYPEPGKFSSINCHLRRAMDKKDDLESLGYLLIYYYSEGKFLHLDGSYTKKEKASKYFEIKMNLKNNYSRDMPKGLQTYFSYLDSLKEFEKPDYNALKSIFKKWLRETNPFLKFNFVWDQLSEELDSNRPAEYLKFLSEGYRRNSTRTSPDRGENGLTQVEKKAISGPLPFSPTMIDLNGLPNPAMNNVNVGGLLVVSSELPENYLDDSSRLNDKMYFLNRNQPTKMTLTELENLRPSEF